MFQKMFKTFINFFQWNKKKLNVDVHNDKLLSS